MLIPASIDNGDLWWVYHRDIYPGPLSLVIPMCIGAMSTGSGLSGEQMASSAPEDHVSKDFCHA